MSPMCSPPETGSPALLPEATGAVNTYPIAVLKQSEHPDLAHGFVELLTGESGRKILSAHGFGEP